MDRVKRKVLLDLFVSPSSLLPFVAGATALLASWATGGDPLLTFGGIAGTLGGLGLFASRWVFGLEKMTENAYRYVIEQQQQQQLAALDELHHRLEQDQDPRTQHLLAQLRQVYDTLRQDIEEQRITVAAHHVLDGVDTIFRVCIDYLDRSLELWQQSRKLRTGARQRTLAQREELIREVADSVEHLEHVVEQLHHQAVRKNQSSLASLRNELDETLRAARRAEQRLDEIGDPNYRLEQFE